MRSRKVSPGLTVTFTMIQSDSHAVPPVTAERNRHRTRESPVRIAGDRALIHRGGPLDHLAVGGHVVAGSDEHHVPRGAAPRRARAWRVRAQPGSGEPLEPHTVCFSRAAPPPAPCCRPSARASAKFANSTVNHSHSAMLKMNHAGLAGPKERLQPQERRQQAPDVDHEHHRVAPLHPCVKACAVRPAAPAAAAARSNSARFCGGFIPCFVAARSVRSLPQHQVLDDGVPMRRAPSARSDAPHQQAPCRSAGSRRSRRVVGMVPSLTGMRFLAASEPAMAKHRHDRPEAAEPHGERHGDVVERGVWRKCRRTRCRCCCRRRKKHTGSRKSHARRDWRPRPAPLRHSLRPQCR